MAAIAPSVPYTRTLAEFALSIRPEQVPDAVKHETSRVVLDILGCMVAGQVTPSGRMVVELAKDERGPLQSTLVGAGKASLLPTAYANTMLANALDFDVWGPEGHMAPVAIPVAIGVAEALDVSGAELLAGVVAGLEVGGRIGGALRRFGAAGGLQSQAGGAIRGQGHMVFTAGLGAAAGRILGLTVDQMHHAMGIAGYGATVPTMRKFSSTSQPPMTKYDHLGLMSQAGIQAALLAQRGFTGDLEVLEGDTGFWRFSGATGCDWDFLTRDLGSHWTIPEVSYKWFPASHSVANPTISLVQRMFREHGLQPDEVEHIEVRRGRNAERPARPIRNQMDAWTIPAYTIAAGVHDVRPLRSWQEPATFGRPDLLAFMKKIDLQPLREGDVTTTGNYWQHWAPIRVTLRARGQTFEGAQDYMATMDDANLVAKFHENVSGLLPLDAANRIEAACWNLEALPKSGDLTEGLGQSERAGASGS